MTLPFDARYRAFADALPTGLLVLSPEGQVLHINTRARRRLPALEAGANLAAAVSAPAQLRRDLQLASRSATARPGAIQFRDDERRWRYLASAAQIDSQRLILLQLSPDEKATSQFAVLNRQIERLKSEVRRRMSLESEREALLEGERAARHGADAANASKDAFLASVSHELRTPLHAMQGWLDLLTETDLDDDKTAHAYAVIQRNIDAQKRLTEDLVDQAALFSGRMSLNLTDLNLNATIEELVTSTLPAAEKKQQSLRLTLPDETLVARADPARMSQIITNLLTNACKYTPEGGDIEILLQRCSSHAEIVVRDTGIGIGADFLPYVFDPFNREVTATTRRAGGLGLGLSITRHLVDLHGGLITVESDGPNQGATFTVSIPLPTFQRSRAVAKPSEDSKMNLPTLQGVTVLLVEDHDDSRELLVGVLRSSGVTVIAVSSSAEALASFDKAPVDIIISDIEMPEEDGYTMLRKWRAQERSAGVSPAPALAVTAHNIGDAEAHALRAGFHSFVSKPVAPSTLLRKIAELHLQAPTAVNAGSEHGVSPPPA